MEQEKRNIERARFIRVHPVEPDQRLKSLSAYFSGKSNVPGDKKVSKSRS